MHLKPTLKILPAVSGRLLTSVINFSPSGNIDDKRRFLLKK